MAFPILRSALFVPANQPKMVDKARTLAADVVVLDLEDGVPRAEKAAARKLLAGLSTTGFGGLMLVRLNALEAGMLQEDVAAALACDAPAVILPKVETAAEVAALCQLLPPEIGVMLSIETARGVLHAEELALADSRVMALAFGPEDFARDLAVERSRDGAERDQAIGLLVLAAASARLPLLDGPYGDFRDLEGLEAECRRVRRIGVKGKFAVHPSQLEVINRVFGPSPEELDWARRAVALFEQTSATGRGAASLDGQMIDEPVYRRAKDLLNAHAT